MITDQPTIDPMASLRLVSGLIFLGILICMGFWRKKGDRVNVHRDNSCDRMASTKRLHSFVFRLTCMLPSRRRKTMTSSCPNHSTTSSDGRPTDDAEVTKVREMIWGQSQSQRLEVNRRKFPETLKPAQYQKSWH